MLARHLKAMDYIAPLRHDLNEVAFFYAQKRLDRRTVSRDEAGSRLGDRALPFTRVLNHNGSQVIRGTRKGSLTVAPFRSWRGSRGYAARGPAPVMATSIIAQRGDF